MDRVSKPEKKSRTNRTVILSKRDMESAIRDQVVTVEMGTALWNRWRALPSGEQTALLGKWGNLPLEKVLLTIQVVLFLTVLFGTGSLLWRVVGPWSIAGMSVIGAGISIVLLRKWFNQDRSALAHMAGTGLLACVGICTWTVTKIAGWGSVGAQLPSGMFGPIADSSNMASVIVNGVILVASLWLVLSYRTGYLTALTALSTWFLVSDLMTQLLAKTTDLSRHSIVPMLVPAVLLLFFSATEQRKAWLQKRRIVTKWLPAISMAILFGVILHAEQNGLLNPWMRLFVCLLFTCALAYVFEKRLPFIFVLGTSYSLFSFFITKLGGTYWIMVSLVAMLAAVIYARKKSEEIESKLSDIQKKITSYKQ